MSCARITINGSVLFDGDIGKTVERPPEFIADIIKPKSAALATLPEFHMQAVALAFSQAVLTNKDLLINVRHENTWWSITVKEH